MVPFLRAPEDKANCGSFFIAGQLILDLPPFLEVTHDEAARKAKVSVRDSENEHQRAMWGMFSAQLRFQGLF